MFYSFFFFFFNDTATTEIYTLSLHDALPIYEIAADLNRRCSRGHGAFLFQFAASTRRAVRVISLYDRSEEHTSELQSQSNLVCRLLLEKKKKNIVNDISVSTTTQSVRSLYRS